MDKVHQPQPLCDHHGAVLQLARHMEIFRAQLEAQHHLLCPDVTSFERQLFPILCQLEEEIVRVPAACAQRCIHRTNGHHSFQELLALLQDHESVLEEMRQRHPGAEPYDPGVMFHVRNKLRELQEPHEEVHHEDDESTRRQG